MPRALARLRGLAPWRAVLLLYGVSRIWSLGLLAAYFVLAKANGWRLGNVGKAADFWSYLNSWDGEFLLRIARQGYPSPLPLDDAGDVVGGTWAFLPLHPALVRLLGLTGLPLDVASVAVATLAGAGAALALHGLLRLRLEGTPALWATALFCFGPLAYLLSVGYSESLFLLLTFAALGQLVRRRYWTLLLLGVLAAFTRPGILAVAVAVGVHLVLRVRAGDRPRGGRLAAVVAAGVGIAAAGLVWPLIAGAVTGRPDAYVQTEMAWWASSIGRVPLVPLTPWFRMAGAYLGPFGFVAVLAALAAAVWYFSRRSLRRLGPEIHAYGASYALYLFAVFLPQQSLPRLVLLPLAPLAGDPRIAARPATRTTLLYASLLLQPVAVVILWSVSFP